MQELPVIQEPNIPNAVLEKYKFNLDDYYKKRSQLISFYIGQAPTEFETLLKMTETKLVHHLTMIGIPGDLAPHITSTYLERIHEAARKAKEAAQR